MTFVGDVDASGKLDADVRVQVADYIRTFKGSRIEVKVQKERKRRTNPQNSWAWGVAYPLIAEALGYDRDEHQELHYALVARCFGTHIDERIGAEVANVRSSKLDTQQFAEYMEWLTRFAAKQWGVVIPLPDESEVA